jgi:hypothetical protein
MKYFLLAICFGSVLSFFDSCKKDSHEITPFDYERAAGIWVPYEITYQDGTVDSGPFTASSIFGVYAESVQLNRDRTFIPVIWVNKDTFGLKTAESGNFEYSPDNKLVFTEGLFDLEWAIAKFKDDDLWLRIYEVLYKFKRQR